MANNQTIFGAGSSYDVTARAVFRGVSNRLVLDPNSELEYDEQTGVHTLMRSWWCRSDLVEQFLPKDGDVDFVFRTLGHQKHHVQFQGPGAIIRTWFNGFIGRNARVLKSEDDIQTQEIELLNQENNVMRLTYLAPTVITKFAALSRPSWKETFQVLPDGKCEPLILMSNDIELTNTRKITDDLTIFGISPIFRRTAFSRKKVGSIWMCQETVQRLLVKQAELPDL